ncbi:iron-siderophore ABC transporter substrate-binding protein [Nocardiopsis sp. CC223A]|uniref:iron-siderophore ABC transporter substrate-binding protein n=1 Tax=Nocardiopsis sp. CC223A TaxID=3044051 RepID=UPI00278BF44C|nr:iron-siderophore ABC transporter substrate-binding protein [Nocardiopsis sp. CC223A]
MSPLCSTPRARVRVLSSAAALAALTLLSACGSAADNASGGEDADGPGGGVAAEAGAFPVTIEHEFGETTVTEAPERIVTLGVTDADAVLALGAVPVGNAGFSFFETGLGPWTDDLVGDAETTLLDSDSEPNIEQIATLEPDLIIGVSAGFDEAVYEDLSQIAPVVARPAGTAAYAVPREEATAAIAAAMGVPDEGAELNAETDALLAEVRAEHPEFADLTGAAVLPYDGKFGAFLPGDARGQFLASLGFEIPEAITEQDTGESFFVEVPAENVEWLDGDVLLVLSDDEDYDVVEAAPVFADLDVVREDAVVVTTIDQRGAMTYNSVLSIPYAVDTLVPRLADALA